MLSIRTLDFLRSNLLPNTDYTIPSSVLEFLNKNIVILDFRYLSKEDMTNIDWYYANDMYSTILSLSDFVSLASIEVEIEFYYDL